MSESVKPFVARPVCPKCGARGRAESGIHRAYHAKGECDFPHTCPPFEHDGPTIKGEHHYLYCRGCGYSWRTRVKPTPTPSAPEVGR